MIAAAALLGAIVLAQPPATCARLEETRAELTKAAALGKAALSTELDRVNRSAGYVLIPPFDATTDASKQAPRAIERLEALCSLKEDSPAPATADTVDRAHVTSILDRPEFAHARQRRRNPVEALQEWFQNLLERLFGSTEAQAFTGGTRLLVLTLALAAVLAVGWRLLRSRRTVALTEARPMEAAGALVLSDPATHLERARVAMAGDPRVAIREALLALLSTLEQRRWARPDRVKTNRELAVELPTRGAPAEAEAEVRRLTAWYDETFYSLSRIPPDQAARFVDDVARFVAHPPGGPT